MTNKSGRSRLWIGLSALLVGLVLGVAIGRTRAPFGISNAPTIDIASLEAAEQDPHPSVINIAELKILVENRTPVTLIDVREPQEYAALHIANSVSMPLGSLWARASEIPRGRAIVVYCTSDLRGDIAARELSKMGLTNVRYLDGGVSAWQNAGLAVAK